MGETELGQFLQHLALNKGVAASTQNQALNALLFLYSNVLNKPLGKLPKLRHVKLVDLVQDHPSNPSSRGRR